MTREAAPNPPVPPDVDLRGLEYMPLYGTHLFGSEFNATPDDTAWRAGITLWWAAWNQKPAGSLPDNDGALCMLAGLGRDLKTWKRIKAHALHGFVLCADGRLYNRFLCVQVLVAWEKRVKERQRKADWRARKQSGDAGRPVDIPVDVPRDSDGTGRGTDEDGTLKSPMTGRDVTGRDVTTKPRTTGDHQPSSLAHAGGGDPARPDHDRIAALVRLLAFHGISTALGHPDLIALAEAQPTIEEVEGAIGEARRYKPAPQRIPVSYLVSVVASRRAARAVPPRNTRDHGRQIAAATAFPDDDPPDRGAIDGSAIRIIR